MAQKKAGPENGQCPNLVFTNSDYFKRLKKQKAFIEDFCKNLSHVARETKGELTMSEKIHNYAKTTKNNLINYISAEFYYFLQKHS